MELVEHSAGNFVRRLRSDADQRDLGTVGDRGQYNDALFTVGYHLQFHSYDGKIVGVALCGLVQRSVCKLHINLGVFAPSTLNWRAESFEPRAVELKHLLRRVLRHTFRRRQPAGGTLSRQRYCAPITALAYFCAGVNRQASSIAAVETALPLSQRECAQ